MEKLAAVTCESAKPGKGRDRRVGHGDGLFLRERPHGTKTWLVECEFGVYDCGGAPGDGSPDWLRHRRQLE